ncbi:Phosphomethylpyrimidine kinase-domain-containing protein [Sphaerosporella brunnea]|uniref:Phosphomethylpyrimidine kinase-domain-containing protein n=1 Tax=Sphaerosporella brunnea TaxID=1250544 RepID=A0A5J5EUW1_9PEZI|nr:Phosphomethylpyrimidine kinase-domain-containing protein [Sphaerosporella brunnea]
MAAQIPTVLTIAGSDSSGGAGIEADLKVITAHGCYGMTTITALTAQNTTGVRAIHCVPEEHVRKSLDAVFEDMPVDVVKTGMLGSAGTINIIAEAIEKYGVEKIVVDPVMVSTSGTELLPDDAIASLTKRLLPKTYLLTPNVPEALCLIQQPQREITSISDMLSVAEQLAAMGPRYVLLKGGHVPFKKDGTRVAGDRKGELMVDILYQSATKSYEVSKKPFIDSKHTHGTGCSIASAIASNLAKGYQPLEAFIDAGKYISWAIETAPGFGKGNGPLNHMHSNYMVPFAPGHFLDYLKGHPKVRKFWAEYTQHEFVKKIGDGTLRQEQFAYYLRQDYLFLIQFARSHALAGYKARSMEDTLASAKTIAHIYEESRMHLIYCESFGISQAEVETTEEDIACTAYTRYVLDIGNSHDELALHVAMAPCLFGYHEIGAWLLAHPDTKHEGNPYYQWITTYGAGENYLKAVKEGRELLEAKARRAGPDRLEELVDIFAHATKMERGFWQMGLEGKERNIHTASN